MSASILVTGGCGFIGSAFAREAVRRGHRVTVLDLLTYAGRRENLHGIEGPGTLELVVGSVAETSLVAELLKSRAIEAVVHFAAESHVDRSIDAPGAFIETNIVGTYQLLNASLTHWRALTHETRARFRYVQISTDEVFGSLEKDATERFREKTPYAPNSPYSASKAAADHLARAWFRTYGLPVITTHCGNCYGPRQNAEKLIPRMIGCALREEKLPLYGDGLQIRDWIHVEDQCQGVFLALEKGKPGEAYCFGGGAERTNLEVTRGVCANLDALRPRASGRPYADLISFVADRPGHDRRYAIDDTKARRELGFAGSRDFQKGLEETVRWYMG